MDTSTDLHWAAELDDFQAGFLAGYFRALRLVDPPTTSQIAEATKALQEFEDEASAEPEDDVPAAPPSN